MIDSSFWTDNKVDKFSPEDKYFMLYLISNPFSTVLGIYKFNVNLASSMLGYAEESVRALLERFENQYEVIFYDKDTDEIAIKNFLRYSIIKGGTQVYYCLKKAIGTVNNKELVTQVFSHLKRYTDLNVTVRGLIFEYEKNSMCEKIKNAKNAIKIAHGTYQNVLLLDEEFADLKTAYGEELASKAIAYLDAYIEENKKTKPDYANKDHYICINRWVVSAVEDSEKRKKKTTKTRYGDFDPTEAFEAALKRSYED